MFTVTIVLLSISLQNIVDSQNCASDGSSASYSETINNNGIRSITSSGCPNHPHPIVGGGVHVAKDQQKTIRIPAVPCFNENGDYDITTTGGPVGITLNGVAIFTAWGGSLGSDAIYSEVIVFDGCGGHSTSQGVYHHHMSPSCLLHQLNDWSNTNISHNINQYHSPQIGWAYDGFPIFGPHGSNGLYTRPCAHQYANINECLDACNGHTHHIGFNFGQLYHYHITGPVGDLAGADLHSEIEPSSDMFPYTIGCLKGVPFKWSNIAGATQVTDQCDSINPAVTAEYVPLVTTGIIEQYVPDLWRKPNGAVCTFDAECQSLYCKQNVHKCRRNNNNPAVVNEKESLIDDAGVTVIKHDNYNYNILWMFVVLVFIGFCLLCFIFVGFIEFRICFQRRKNRLKMVHVQQTDNQQQIVQVEVEETLTSINTESLLIDFEPAKTISLNPNCEAKMQISSI